MRRFSFMSVLLIHGNKNQYTFANSIVAANNKSYKLFKKYLTDIYIIHSAESKKELINNTEWVEYLSKNNIREDIFVEKIIEITNQKDSIQKFVDYFESIIKGLSKPEQLIVDLSNGTALQKNVFSIAAYILDIKKQYLIDISKLFYDTENRKFFNQEKLAESYISAPDCTCFDSIAYLNITEIIRYKQVISEQAEKYIKIDEDYADEKFFTGNLEHSIELKLKEDITNKDNAIYRISAASIGTSIEEIIRIIFQKLELNKEYKDTTLAKKIEIIEEKIDERMDSNFDFKLLKLFNELMRHLRNSTTHKGNLLTDLEKFKAELSVKLAFPFMEFYTDIIYPELSSTNVSDNQLISNDNKSELIPENEYYYGLDGDNTGLMLEKIFLEFKDNQEALRDLSRSVQNAIKKISDKIQKITKHKKSVIYAGGDSILFKGFFKQHELEEIKEIYKKSTKRSDPSGSGLTCSIGYGRTLTETYLALKIAKTQPGKNSIFGFKLADKGISKR